MKRTINHKKPPPTETNTTQHLTPRVTLVGLGLKIRPWVSDAPSQSSSKSTRNCEAEAEGCTLHVRPISASGCRTAIQDVVVLTAATEHPFIASIGAARICYRAAWVIAKPILHPLPHVSVHIIWVWLF